MSRLQSPRDRAIQSMFDRIAGRYDLLNRVISFRLDKFWRNKAAEAVVQNCNGLVLDLGAGTGDLTFTVAQRLQTGKVIGLDFSAEMVRRAAAKQRKLPSGDRTAFVIGSALLLPFRESSFDGVVTGFVLRNISDLALFFLNSFRALKPGGTLVTVDMFPPEPGFFSALYSIYFYKLVPLIGALLARDRSAYSYLSESVQHFEPAEAIAQQITGAGFERVAIRKFLHGAVCMHIAEKPDSPQT